MGKLLLWVVFFALAPVIALKIGFRNGKKGDKK